jgi:hypothetical protein
MTRKEVRSYRSIGQRSRRSNALSLGRVLAIQTGEQVSKVIAVQREVMI